MTTPNERDEFERMRLVAQIERARDLIAQYEEHQEFYRPKSRTAGTNSVGSMSGWEDEAMTDPHVQALRDLLRTDHEAWIAEVQRWTDEAGAAGDMRGSAATWPMSSG